MCTLFRTTENLVNFVWESVDPDRVEENDYLGDMDLQIMEQMQSFQSTASEASKDVDYEYEDEHDDDETSDSDNDEFEEIDLFDMEEDIPENEKTRVLEDLIEEESDDEVKKVLEKKLEEIRDSITTEEHLGPAYEVLVNQLRENDEKAKVQKYNVDKKPETLYFEEGSEKPERVETSEKLTEQTQDKKILEKETQAEKVNNVDEKIKGKEEKDEL